MNGASALCDPSTVWPKMGLLDVVGSDIIINYFWVACIVYSHMCQAYHRCLVSRGCSEGAGHKYPALGPTSPGACAGLTALLQHWH